MKDAIILLRPWQWTKNLFVLLPMFFAASITNGDCWAAAIPALIAMCLISSCVYCINDIVDADSDRRHPVKCRRPIAAGRISKPLAAIIAAIAAIASVAIILLADSALLIPHKTTPAILALLLSYLLLNIAYCLWLKHLAVVDIVCIGLGFALRIFVGGAATNIWVSPWLICLSFLLTIFLAFAKRRDDLLLSQNLASDTRRSIKNYNLIFIDHTITILATATILCYIIYTMQPEVEARFNCNMVYITALFVIAGILRYLQIIFVKQQSGQPSKIILHDRPLQICCLLWVASFILIIYL
jgi:4-hydroxybenzoate polyprenyltransferase